MRQLLLLLPLALGACSGDDDKLTCRLGELSGTWRITYEETNGTCGEIPAETVNLTPGGSKIGTDPCTYHLQDISSDKCRLDFDYTCPTTDGKGTQQWTGVTKQVEEGRLESDTTIQLVHPSGNCRSTYKGTLTKL